MIFKQIAAMLAAGDSMMLSIVKMPDERLHVVARHNKTGDNAALGLGLQVTEAPDVLDAEFAGALATYAPARLSLVQQVEERVEILRAAAEQEKATKRDAVKKASSGKPVATPSTAGKSATVAADTTNGGAAGGAGESPKVDGADEPSLF